MQPPISIVWFRQDLRLSDNQAIIAASEIGTVLPIYIFDDCCAPDSFKMGSASKIWLNDSLAKLNEALKNHLNLYTGPAEKIIQLLIKRYPVKSVFCNAVYSPWHLNQTKAVQDICNQARIQFQTFNSNYLYQPTDVLKENGEYYKVFTAYKNKTAFIESRTVAHNKNKNINFIKDAHNKTTLETLNLLPEHSWYQTIKNEWVAGETSAQKKLTFFIENHLNGYKEDRNYPYKNRVSKLSPHLHFGEISASQILDAIHKVGHLYAKEEDIEHFKSELIWREFSCYLLYHFKDLPIKNFNPKFNQFPWEDNLHLFQVWQKGNTGYPLIDAGMRELWQTGYMHNRVRMVVASFLVKNLNIHWQVGMNWFWDCLVDADLANNSASWQWVAGSGVDAAPYFRIFNPTTQGEKFDNQGEYTKKFVPELKAMPNKYLFKPWSAPTDVLKSAGVILGTTYPKPVVDFTVSRKAALNRYNHLKTT